MAELGEYSVRVRGLDLQLRSSYPWKSTQSTEFTGGDHRVPLAVLLGSKRLMAGFEFF